MLVTMVVMVGIDTVGKVLVQTYPVPQVIWARYAFNVIFLLCFFHRRFFDHLRTARPSLQFVRSLLIFVTTVLYFGAIHYIPLADANAIMALSPVLVTALAVPLLSERVGLHRWIAVVTGFTGAVVIIRPGLDIMNTASLVILSAAICNALYQICTRRLSRSDPVLTTLVHTSTVGVVVTCAAVPFFWVPPDFLGWTLMVAMGLFGSLGHFLLIKAFSYAPAPALSPYSYSGLAWSALLGFAVFGDVPDLWTTAGAGVIVASGLYIIHREHVRRRTDAPS